MGLQQALLHNNLKHELGDLPKAIAGKMLADSTDAAFRSLPKKEQKALMTNVVKLGTTFRLDADECAELLVALSVHI